ncbi:DUF6568 family protein [Anaerorhabdus furcosa]|uniref:Uncharacterized protein n=1 Tax=Anaerorhabdus furcosa TaxID=118967 RepID=A0A1T4NIJ4_9FIRM|nr:DUF6568 family protein [Anaerorhabdus furcosa]SJZ79079.1 hypothetical protein SAMN02745191_1650 [Anaerorhabdus furcosa]
MIKKLLISLMSLCTVISLLLVFYCFFTPKNNDNIVQAYSNTLIIPYPALNEYLLTNGDSSTSYLFFCKPDSADCQYIQNTVMKTLEAEQGSSLSELIDYVDVTELEDNLMINQLTDDWGIKNYPAFVSVTTANGELTINNSIQWDIENPMSARELKQWMMTNKIWSGLFEEKDAEVLVPTN